MFAHLRTYFTHKRSFAIGIVFIAVGFLFGNWATLIPFIKQKFDLNDAQLGLLLLFLPFGATITNPISTLLIHRFGMKTTTIFGIFFLGIAFAAPFYFNNIYLLASALIFVGVFESITNVAMNTCVSSIEMQENVSIMSTCHGMFSAGLMLGSIIASILIGIHLSPIYQMTSIALLVMLVSIIIRPIILSIHEEKHFEGANEAVGEAKKFVFPKGALLLMIAISLCTNVTEGTMADWTAVYMRNVVHTSDYFIGWGLAGYSMLMALGRFLGDNIIPRFGANRVLKVGGFMSALGILLAVLLPFTTTAIIGFALVGAGVSCGAPILYSSAARIPNMAKGAGLATMNTFSIAGFLAGPVFIGFISKLTNLPLAIGLVAILALTWSFLSDKVKLY